MVDILSGISVDWLKALPWLLAIASGMFLCFGWPRRAHVAALGSVIVLGAANIGAGIYVLSHVGDGRWRAGERLSDPSLTEIPVVGGFLGPLDSFLGGVADGVNGFIDFSAALPVALDFFIAAGWALFASLPMAAFALAASYRAVKRRRAEFAGYKLQLEDLRAELDGIKRHLGHGNLG